MTSSAHLLYTTVDVTVSNFGVLLLLGWANIVDLVVLGGKMFVDALDPQRSVIIDKNNVSELLRLSNHFLVSKLKKYCAEYLEQNLDISNCLSVKDMAEKYNMPALSTRASAFIQIHIEEVLLQEEILSYPFHKIEDLVTDKVGSECGAAQLCEIRQHLQSLTIPQNSLLKFLSAWVWHDVIERECHIRSLLGFIEWHQVEQSIIIEHLSREPLYTASPISLYFFLKCLYENGLSLPQEYSTTYQELFTKYGKQDMEVIDGDCFLSMAVSSAIGGLQNDAENTKESKSNITSSDPPMDVSSVLTDVVKVPSMGINCWEDTTMDVSSQELNLEPQSVSSEMSPSVGNCPSNSNSISSGIEGQERLSGKSCAQKYPMREVENYNTGDVKLCSNLDSSTSDTRVDSTCNTSSMECRNSGNADSTTVSLPPPDGSKKKKSGERVKCQICGHVARDSRRLERHTTLAHSRAVTYKCGMCGFTCRWNKEYFAHVKSHFRGPPYQCDSLLLLKVLSAMSDFTCDRIHLILAHRVRHVEEKPFHCEECDYRCRSKASLAAHMRTHNPDPMQNKFKFCNDGGHTKCVYFDFKKAFESLGLLLTKLKSLGGACSLTFDSESGLEEHWSSHCPEEPYLCDECDFSTMFLSHLVLHRRIHSASCLQPRLPAILLGDKFEPWCAPAKEIPVLKQPLQPEPTEDAKPNGSAVLRPHVCGVCGRGFHDKSHLVRHERIHLGEKPFRCDQCEYASSRRDKLKEHQRRHHKKNAAEQAVNEKASYRPNNSESRPVAMNSYDAIDMANTASNHEQIDPMLMQGHAQQHQTQPYHAQTTQASHFTQPVNPQQAHHHSHHPLSQQVQHGVNDHRMTHRPPIPPQPAIQQQHFYPPYNTQYATAGIHSNTRPENQNLAHKQPQTHPIGQHHNPRVHRSQQPGISQHPPPPLPPPPPGPPVMLDPRFGGVPFGAPGALDSSSHRGFPPVSMGMGHQHSSVHQPQGMGQHSLGDYLLITLNIRLCV
ncbi:hypothetical protein J437_LFUL012486 [Ladona fulva]|uniref:C2H2-type domain-containing protein n=1 Tax=Ladona fulva TaxID=123851 RepID=A0A8K0KDF6_LADFU|nr:hypothetical protein J437_LFUL012486 [Ladona fulva]